MAKENYLLTFELVKDGDGIEIHCNKAGLESLLSSLQRLLKTRDHEHLMTPSWSGNELTEKKQGDTNLLINQVTIHFWDDIEESR
jgi:hypothetical protein